jgi:L-lactate dehydrogenase complex protein LldF
MPPDQFYRRIRTALSDDHLHSALNANAERRQAARTAAYAALPGGADEWRRRAHALRAGTIARLDEYLAAFRLSAESAGWQIHTAEDAYQAVEHALAISRQCGARRVAKSKTMLGEEIRLNQALERAGLEVIETDLGEWIVQLRGEAPAHMITPAVHLTRADVGRTFTEKLGLPYTEEIPTLTATARQALREVFLSADIGITGANFGVVQTGQVCILSNEGNARMVSTLPPVHIALLGMERLVPTLDDLALMLALLPRAASGLKATVYTSLIGAPRRPGEADGPQERHLILIDNGRQALRSSPLNEALLCIRCGACLNACPVFREIGGHAYVSRQGELSSYPGPIGSVLAPALFGPDFSGLARASSLCGACREACPVDIDLPKLLLRVRAGLQDTPPTVNSAEDPEKSLMIRPGAGLFSSLRIGREGGGEKGGQRVPFALAWGLRLFTAIAVSPWRFAAAQRMAGLFGRLITRPARKGSPAWLRLPAFTGWGLSRDFPAPDPRPFRKRWKAISQEDELGELLKERRGNQAPSPYHKPAAPPSTAGPSDLERFLEEARARGCQVTLCSSGELPGRLCAFFAQKGISTIFAWEAPHLPPGLLEALGKAGIRLTHAPDPEVRIGLTGCQAGIAETGSLALPGGPGRPLSASLLPEVHVAVLKAQDIYPDLTTFFRASGPTPSLALVSGPSRTADIEMSLTIGVHGPKEVHIYCLNNYPPRPRVTR